MNISGYYTYYTYITYIYYYTLLYIAIYWYILLYIAIYCYIIWDYIILYYIIVYKYNILYHIIYIYILYTLFCSHIYLYIYVCVSIVNLYTVHSMDPISQGRSADQKIAALQSMAPVLGGPSSVKGIWHLPLV